MAVAYPTEQGKPAGRFLAGTGGWRRFVMVGTPIVAVVAVMVVGGLISAYVYEINRRGAESLSNDLLEAIDSRITIQVAGYLAPAVQLAESARAIGGDGGVFDSGHAAAAFMATRLDVFPQIAGYSYADPGGNFIYVTRNELGGFDTKLVDRRSGGPRVSWTRHGRDGQVVETAQDPADTFDPRARPWYVGAEREGRPYWSGAYLFYTLRRPGMTYALPHYAEGRGLTAVSGVDIELASLSRFLKRLHIGVHGKALVVDRKGRVIAYPSDNWMADAPEGASVPKLDEVGDPVLTRVFNRLRIEGFDPRTFDLGDERIILSDAVMTLTGRDWLVLIVVPEADFLGFVSSSSWIALALSGVVFLIVAALAALMMWRSLRAERRDRAARERQEALEARAAALADCAAASNLMDRSSIDGVHRATERAAEICGAKRVGVWRLAAAGRSLVCEDSYDASANAHTAGAELHRDEFSGLFTALQAGTPIDAPHAADDPRTRELAALYLQPLGVEGVHIAPIHSGARLLGMLKVEDPNRGEGAAGLAEFCTALASLFALRYLGGSLPQPDAPGAVAATAPPVGEQRVERALGQRQAALEHRLLHSSTSMAGLAVGELSQAAVAVIKLPEWLPLGRSDGGGGARMDAVVDDIRREIARSGVDHAALLDDQVVLVAFSGGPGAIAADARLVALAAIELRDRLIERTSGWGDGAQFRIAIDVGPVMVSPFGDGARNLWGGAIAVAKVLAASGSRRAITASETAYGVLSGDFLFRQRGTYFLPETGTMRTFVLVGAL
jgi:hypothetical protein